MTREHRRFVRIYYVDLERDYPAIWFDPTCLSTFVRLLALSDKAWPNPAELPRAVRRRDLDTLSGAGLVTVIDNGRYVIKGFVNERSLRSEKAKMAVGSRSDRPTYVPTDVPSSVPTNDVPARARAGYWVLDTGKANGEGVQGEDPADAYWTLVGRYPTPAVLKWIDDLIEQFGQSTTTRALARAFIQDASSKTLMGRTADILRAEARELDRKEREEERVRIREKRALPKSLSGPDAELRKLLVERAQKQGVKFQDPADAA